MLARDMIYETLPVIKLINIPFCSFNFHTTCHVVLMVKKFTGYEKETLAWLRCIWCFFPCTCVRFMTACFTPNGSIETLFFQLGVWFCLNNTKQTELKHT